MNTKHLISRYAVLACLIGTLPCPGWATIRVGNKSRTYAESYNQVNANTATNTAATRDYGVNYVPATTQDTDSDLPIRVANANLAKQIIAGDTNIAVGRSDLARCAAIYPSGEFEWDAPTGGIGRGGATTCVSVVEMRAIGAGENASDLVVARATVAAGDSFTCNISDFPESGYTEGAGQFLFPSDREPTLDDVIAVMNQEQKQNAGFKIAASAIIGGLGGNMFGKNDIGNDSMFGTSSGKIQGTAIGAVAGAAIGAAGTYSGKVAGDTIMSTGMNAAAGGIMGNVMASGNAILRVENCTTETGGKTSCLLGYVTKLTEITAGGNVKYYYDIDGNYVQKCTPDKNNVTKHRCERVSVSGIKLECTAYNDNFDAALKDKFANCTDRYAMDNNMSSIDANPNGKWLPLKGGKLKSGRQEPAIITFPKEKTFGWSEDDWKKYKKKHSNTPIYRNLGNGKIGTAYESTEYTLDNFFPLYRDVDDGAIVDLSNHARMKSTMIGAGVGGALGAFSGYQGAQSDIQERWVSAVREYKDSLGKVYCITGKRYLGQYNDVITIPNMSSGD